MYTSPLKNHRHLDKPLSLLAKWTSSCFFYVYKSPRTFLDTRHGFRTIMRLSASSRSTAANCFVIDLHLNDALFLNQPGIRSIPLHSRDRIDITTKVIRSLFTHDSKASPPSSMQIPALFNCSHGSVGIILWMKPRTFWLHTHCALYHMSQRMGLG